MPGARRILDNAVPGGRLLVTDFELVEVCAGAEPLRLKLVAYSFAVALVGQKVAVLVIEEGGGADGCLRLDNTATLVMLEGVCLAGIQDVGLVIVPCAHFPLDEGITYVVVFLNDVAGPVPVVSLSKLAVLMQPYKSIS